MTDDERYVRERWEWVEVRPAEEMHFDDRLGEWKLVIYRTTLSMWYSTEAEAWSAAKAFTVQREEEIRQQERNVWGIGNVAGILHAQINGWIVDGYTGAFIVDQVRSLCILCRILAREQSHLDTLRRGMKTEGGKEGEL